jgi:glycosyltransferase involved in cell wall biosynthesis
MRVGIDVSPLAQTRAGTARHLKGLLRELERRPEVEVRRFGFGGDRPQATLARELAWYPLALPRAARRAGVDVLHCPSYRGPLRDGPPLVVTVHDLAVFRHPEAFPPWTRTYSRLVVPVVARAARRVIAVSEFTRRELVELLGVPEERIRVVPNAVDEEFRPDGPAADGDYVLAVGTLEPRKNLARVGEAARQTGVELRVVGARGWGGVSANGSGVRWLGELPDDELARLYRGALCLAYPSLYEGFGIPILEAMACGAPVVTSRGGATEEIAGGAAVLVDPLDPGAIARGIEEAAARRDELRRLGLERTRLTWPEVATATLEVYREAACSS